MGTTVTGSRLLWRILLLLWNRIGCWRLGGTLLLNIWWRRLIVS